MLDPLEPTRAPNTRNARLRPWLAVPISARGVGPVAIHEASAGRTLHARVGLGCRCRVRSSPFPYGVLLTRDRSAIPRGQIGHGDDLGFALVGGIVFACTRTGFDAHKGNKRSHRRCRTSNRHDRTIRGIRLRRCQLETGRRQRGGSTRSMLDECRKREARVRPASPARRNGPGPHTWSYKRTAMASRRARLSLRCRWRSPRNRRGHSSNSRSRPP